MSKKKFLVQKLKNYTKIWKPTIYYFDQHLSSYHFPDDLQFVPRGG